VAGAEANPNGDFSKGYYQIPLSSQSRDKTAFITPFGLYEFIAMLSDH
jgi:hypothetical protein